jgi:tRNA G18 (ribose-2'-O)-methylase SpoU
MAIFIKINDINDPRISVYRSLKAKHLESQGAFIAEGPKVVRSLIASGIKITSFLTTETFYKSFKPHLSKLSKDAVGNGRDQSRPVYIMPREEIEKVIGFRFHQGIMAVARSPEKLSLERCIGKIKEPYLIVALNGVNDPENVGLIARNAAAFGASAFMVDRKTYDPYYRRAVRVSMGTIFNMPVIYTDKLCGALKALKRKYGTKIITTGLDHKSKDISGAAMDGNICVIFGNEDKGVDRDVAKDADLRLKIPIEDSVDSLNVASASAILLREAYLQRNNGKIHRKRR